MVGVFVGGPRWATYVLGLRSERRFLAFCLPGYLFARWVEGLTEVPVPSAERLAVFIEAECITEPFQGTGRPFGRPLTGAMERESFAKIPVC
jgi:hypothetical protein